MQDREQFEALLAHSRYHNVRGGIAYPATVLTAGEFEPRVDAYHAKKMAVLLQAGTASSEPIVLRVDFGGHGIGSSLDETVVELPDMCTFVFDRLSSAYRPAAAAVFVHRISLPSLTTASGRARSQDARPTRRRRRHLRLFGLLVCAAEPSLSRSG